MTMSSPARAASADSVEAASTAASAAAPQAVVASIPFKPAATSDAGGSSFTAASVVCLAFLVLAVLVLRRWGPRAARLGGAARVVEVVETSRLADRMRVSVIRYRGQELLVAHSDHAATVLASGPSSLDGVAPQ